MPIRNPLLLLVPMLLPLGLAGCGGNTVRPVAANEYNDPRYSSAGQGTLFGNDAITFGDTHRDPSTSAGAGDGGSALGVNAYLWRGALDTLAFMPLASADPFGGVIITDWYEPPSSPDERFKATAYILGRQLRADGVRVSVFRQVRQDGTWVDAAVSPETVGAIEAKVLERARDLRVQTAAR
jgi:hypothetical protein